MQKVRVRAMKKVSLLVCVCMLAVVFFTGVEAYGDEIKVGIYNGDTRAYEAEDMANALKSQGIKTGYFGKKEVREGNIYQYNLLLFSGGYNAGIWADYPFRLRLADYVDRGYGVMLIGFRTGWVRNGSRPIFPEVGVAYNKVNTNSVIVIDKKHEITQGIPEKIYHSYWDHQVMRVGPSGKPLMEDTGREVILITGILGKGRVILSGFDFSKPIEGITLKLFTNCISYLAQAGPKDKENVKKIKEEVELKVLRREKIWDYTHSKRGFDTKPGIIPDIKYDYETSIDIIIFKLKDFKKYAITDTEKRNLAGIGKKADKLRKRLESNYQNLLKETKKKIKKMKLVQLKNLPADLEESNFRKKMFNLADIEKLQKEVKAIAGKYLLQKEKVMQKAEEEERKKDYLAIHGLIENLKNASSDIRAKAALELGRIGDERAINVLIASINDSSCEVSRNSIYALGWMQAKESVPALIKATGSKDKWVRRRATQALGLIGDKRVVPVLEKLKIDKDPFVCENADFSLQWIENGGIKQPDFLSLKDNFYWMTNRYHAFYGRHFSYYGNNPRNPEGMAFYIKEGGGTGTINGGKNRCLQQEGEEKFKGYLTAMDNSGLKWLEDLSVLKGCSGIEKKGCQGTIFKWFDEQAFAGFWYEECMYPVEVVSKEGFQNYLRAKYGKQILLGFGIEDISWVDMPKENTHDFLYAEFLEYTKESILENWREGVEWIHALRKGTSVTFSTSEGNFMHGANNYFSLYPSLGGVIDVHGPESYGTHSTQCMFEADLARDGEVRPVMVEFYQMYVPDNVWIEKGFASSFLHGENYFVWHWTHVFKHPADKSNPYLWGWDKGRWDVCKRMFCKGKQISEYLIKTDTPKRVALLYSGRTEDLIYGTFHAGGGRGKRYFQHQLRIYEALLQSHIQSDVIWTETLTREKLAQYKTVLLFDAKSMSKEEIALIRNWVKEGGVLISSGTTTLFDQWNNLLKDYSLADVFGVRYVRTNPYSALNLEEIWQYVNRDIKPETIGKMKITQENSLLKDFSSGDEINYDLDLGYDIIKPTTGKVVARWEESREPAIVVNNFGKGKSVFISAVYPGLSINSLGAAVHTLDVEFWPGARELISNAIIGGLTVAESSLSYRVKNCRKEVEVAVRTQDEKNRWMVHLFDYAPSLVNNRNVELEVFCPKLNSKKLEIFYPYPQRKNIRYKITKEGGIKFKVRNFDVHEIVVIEY